MQEKHKPVSVVWNDARLYTATYTQDECKQKQMGSFTTLGYLIEQNDITTTIAMEYNDDNDYRNVMLIPTGSIISINNLTLVSGV